MRILFPMVAVVLYNLARVITGTYSFLSVIVNIPAPAELVVTQLTDQVFPKNFLNILNIYNVYE